MPSSLARRLVIRSSRPINFSSSASVAMLALNSVSCSVAFGTSFARDVQQVVAHEDAGEVDVGSQSSEVRFDQAVVGLELIELNVDLLRLAGRRKDRQRDEQQEAAEAEGSDQPGLEWHTRHQPGGLLPRMSPEPAGIPSTGEGWAARQHPGGVCETGEPVNR